MIVVYPFDAIGFWKKSGDNIMQYFGLVGGTLKRVSVHVAHAIYQKT